MGENMANPDRQPLRAICLDGGGYLGLATASFLAEHERHFKVKFSDRFDLFCGTSTGGIIALALAKGLRASAIVELYRTIGRTVFRNRFPGCRTARWIRGLLFARYSNGPLRDALLSAFGDTTLGDISARGKYVVVPTFSLTNGSPRVFKTDHSPELSRDSGYLLREIALATSAAPVFLPIVRLKSPTSGETEQFIDGGVYANNPTLVAFTEAVGYLGRHPSELHILSVATPRDPRSLAERSVSLNWFQRFRLSRGLFAWGPNLAELFIGSSMKLTHSAVTRVMLGLKGENGKEMIGRYVRCDLPTGPGLALDNADERATTDLIAIGTSTASTNAERAKIEPLLIGPGVATHG